MRHQGAVLAVGVAVAGAISAYARPDRPPAPSIVPVSWQLELQYQDPQMITLLLPGQTKPQTFWYMLYTVTNQTGKEQMFVPELALYTDTGEIRRAAEGVPTAVFTAIQRRHNNPLLVDQAAIIGKLLQGEDNAKDGVAIWADFDPEARAFDVFISGLSGERAKVKLPTPITETVTDDSGNKKRVTRDEIILSKTLQLSYGLPGEAPARPRTPASLQARQWVMR